MLVRLLIDQDHYQRLEKIKMYHSTYFPMICVSAIFEHFPDIWATEMYYI